MDKDNNNHYLENVNRKIKKLDNIKKQYELQLIDQSKLLEHSNSVSGGLKFTNNMLNDHYNSLLRLLEQQGMIFEMKFTNYIPHQWENLIIIKKSNGYEIQSKAGGFIMMLNNKYSKIIQDVNKKQSQSLIVIRVRDRLALVQLRFNLNIKEVEF
ncbi:hypothetical protein [Clostridium estertheticum]|uniref:Uncharacterized protein n=2 Tax=Clostridium estertheticum TaxID=238834 RepID=A0A1J0GLV5_9CLOT|nr:hypothetical protein [Clostridium estertheticum]APC41870.1 hypothetical protein A7L45_18255 [Clostridium estertheticum subsp. estertheticum]MBU3073282.1 hypothetical protein [Clostridium estertheticum]MBU3163477.1 hypothetical protein [Clostridium estertheticum]MBZ9616232.1 hypothetical protein [Clostridium estertheticum subsp. laramiense]WAG71975.1 hypothetical protein LL032_12310 [Clostridium estertheticum]